MALDSVLQAHPEWSTTLTIVPWAEYRARLMETLTGPMTPYQAVCVPGHLWIPELAAAGLLAPFDPMLDRLTDLMAGYQPDEILPSVARESRYGGSQYMLPLFSDGHLLFYRSDEVAIPATDGVPLVSPTDVAGLAARVHRPPELFGLALKADASEILLDWLPYLWAEGGDILDDSGRPAFAGTAGIRALEAYCALRQFCPPDTQAYGNDEIASAIKQGRVALAATWGGQAASIMLAPDMAHRESYRVATYPQPWNATWGIAVPVNQDLPIQEGVLSVLLQAMGPQTDRAVTRLAGSPVRESSYGPAERERYPWLAAQYEMLKRARTLPVHPKVGAFLGALYEAVHDAFTGNATAREALARAESVVRKVLGEM
jgi:multiple sugar transport system substrate-binding protein